MLQDMTQEKWEALTTAERERLRDNSGLSPQLIGLEGWHVEVVDEPGEKPRRFIVGKSTGWRPCHLEMARVSSSGGGAANKKYHSVSRIRKER